MPEADAGSANPLLAVLRDRIRRHGPIRVDQYMQACLGDPEHGYYRRAQAIGAGGDFITAPEISQVFGELIGLWCAVCWQGLKKPAPLRFVELGPGRGTLMADALRAARALPQFLDAISVHLIEVSERLREAQRLTLASFPRRRESTSPGRTAAGTCVHPRLRGDDVAWHDTLQEVPPGPAVVVANEFLDALPIRQLVFMDGAWRERMIDIDPTGALCFAVGDPVDYDAGPRPKPGAVVELRAGEDELMANLARRNTPFIALFVDYGPEPFRLGDTLQAVRRHAYADPLAEPGRADLTAHVQFAVLARKARAAGLAADGPLTQAQFLGALGVVERARRLMAENPHDAGGIEAAVQRLVSPTGMGGLCKAMVVRSAALSPPPPFG